MLNYFASGKRVVYLTPGCGVHTVACECTTEGQAEKEAARLNQDQQNRQKAVEAELALLGRRRKN
ncbi:hypothetical protein [Herbaspirillum huttiense]|jgi:hypothetical protein|uniref:Uncharacterized protein n=2 Tax=Herbaspirillum huttiense TaxID=863372 RepID=A0AAJ2LTX8_9BURK|nr:hypothetical protein [Herbaspirillum huttiense]MDR9839432.1 hypothetical protein [Herbaspirillum huttiense]